MIKIKKIFSNIFISSKNKKLFENIISLYMIHGLTLLISLIIFPFTARIFGPTKFGEITFVINFINYFLIITEYSFNYTAAGQITENPNDEELKIKVFNTVFRIKIYFLIFSLIFLIFFLEINNNLIENGYIFYWFFLIAVGSILSNFWFYLGIEKVKYVASFNLIGHLIFIILFFILIRNENDFMLFIIIRSIYPLLVGLCGLIIILFKFNIIPIKINLREIKYQLKEGWLIFLSTSAGQILPITSVVLLGLIINNTAVGYYEIANKLILTMRGMIAPISFALFPNIKSRLIDSKKDTKKFIKKCIFSLGLIALIISFLIFTFSDLIIEIFGGTMYSESIIILRILSIIPFLAILNNLFGVQILLTLNHRKAFSSVYISIFFINLLISVIFVPIYSFIATSFISVLTELTILISFLIYCKIKIKF